jgi:hypothetical protein
MPGTAQFIRSADDAVRDGDTPIEWYGEVGVYRLDPPLNGYEWVVASTIPNAPHVTSRGTVEHGVETFIYGVIPTEAILMDFKGGSEFSRLEEDARGSFLRMNDDELPGSGWGNTVEDAFAEAGYRIV